MRVDLVSTEPLRFVDGSPVRAASALAALGTGWLVAQDDATHAAWLRDGLCSPLRLLPPVDGLDVFSEPDGSKHLKPDLEAACAVPGGVLLLGSGSTPARMRSVLVRPAGEVVVTDLSSTFAAVAAALDLPPDALNLEGACLVGDDLRWFHRGLPAAGLGAASVDLPLRALLTGAAEPRRVRRYDDVAVTDAVAVPDRGVLVSTVLEDSPTAYDDGPVLASGLALIVGDEVVDRVELPRVAGRIAKVEGLAVLDADAAGVHLLATVDADDPTVASSLLTLHVEW